MSSTERGTVKRLWARIKDPWATIKQLSSKFNSLVSWSNLAIFGNNPIVKLSILAPLVAQVLIHQKIVPFLEKYNFTNLGWLYAALMCFFVAQLIYNFLCDRDIKNYPSGVRFIQAMEATTPDDDLNRDYFEIYKKYFKKYGGAIDQKKYDHIKALTYAKGLDLKEGRLGIDSSNSAQYDKARQVIEEILFSIQEDQQTRVVDWELLASIDKYSISEMFQTEKFVANTVKTSDETKALFRMTRRAAVEFTSSHWRAKAIKRRYDKLNFRNLPARIIAAALYGVGTVYFVWIGSLNVYKVLDQYGWIEPIKNLI